MTGVAFQDNFDKYNIRFAYGSACAFHFVLLMWNPTLLSKSALQAPPLLMHIEFQEKMPDIIKPQPPAPKPVVQKKEKKKPLPKAKKAGLSRPKIHPVAVHTRKSTGAPARPKRAPVTIPKFIPRSSEDEPLTGATHPNVVGPVVSAKATAPVLGQGKKLKAKTRGVHISDVHFELSEGGGLVQSAGAGPVVKIPIGEERGEAAVLASAPAIHSAPRSGTRVAGQAYQVLGNEGYGELAGKNRKGLHGGIIATGAHASEGEIQAAAFGTGGNGHGRGPASDGVEIGGPVGDRRVVSRRVPEYPAWAEEKGISALVKIYFTVMPNGHVRRTMRVLKSSGYSELDQIAIEALRTWVFAETEADSTEESWGVITFRFTLN